jgi:hypothetical protein
MAITPRGKNFLRLQIFQCVQSWILSDQTLLSGEILDLLDSTLKILRQRAKAIFEQPAEQVARVLQPAQLDPKLDTTLFCPFF